MKLFFSVFLFYTIFNNIFVKGSNTFGRDKRAVVKNFKNNWNTTIYYYIDLLLDHKPIEDALNAISENTCLKFTKAELFHRSGKVGFHFKKGWSCFGADPNHNHDGFQNIQLNSYCNTFISVMRYVGISLGLQYEHQRPDRDNFVKIHLEHIRKTDQELFTKLKDTETLNVSYNYGSGMHFGKDDFSSGAFSSIDPIDIHYNSTIGQKNFDFNDYKMINALHCSHVCPKKHDCFHGGYTDPKDCKTCVCPSIYDGDYCELLGESDTSCRNVYRSIQNKQESKHKAKGNKTCHFHFDVEPGYNVEINIISLKYTKSVDPDDSKHHSLHENHRCEEYEGLQVKYRDDKGPMGALFCNDMKDYKIYSEGSSVDMRFIGLSDDDEVKFHVRKVFIDKRSIFRKAIDLVKGVRDTATSIVGFCLG
uniref:Metalloendopeptidase n=1 Tax=Parastrongyloides trichosuri TaxID=131310 RepID=A0A0N5A641_PARTI